MLISQESRADPERILQKHTSLYYNAISTKIVLVDITRRDKTYNHIN